MKKQDVKLFEVHTPKLSGLEILEIFSRQKVKGSGMSKSDMVREAGYSSIKRDGRERLNFTGFYEALIKAKDEYGLSHDQLDQLTPRDVSQLVGLEKSTKPTEEQAMQDLAILRGKAQQKLKKGRPLSQHEVDALPGYQQNALRCSQWRRNSETRSRLTGKELTTVASSLFAEGLMETSICIRCGYSPDKIGSFRRAFAKANRVQIAPLAYMLANRCPQQVREPST